MSDGFADLGEGRPWYERAALLIVGEEDIAEVGEIDDLVVAQVPGPSKRVVAETDQLVNVGKPERFNRLALVFLAFAG